MSSSALLSFYFLLSSGPEDEIGIEINTGDRIIQNAYFASQKHRWKFIQVFKRHNYSNFYKCISCKKYIYSYDGASGNSPDFWIWISPHNGEVKSLGISIIEMVTNILKDSIRGVESIFKRLLVIFKRLNGIIWQA